MLLTLALLLIGVLSGLYALTCWRAYRAEQSYPSAGQFVVVNGLRLHYVRQGSGPSVVLLHGSEGFWQDFKAVIELLAGQYDVIAFDRPGHGYSDAPRASDCAPDAQAALIHDALLQMGVSRPLLVGHSWSGTLMLAYALMYPQEVAGLTLLGGWVYAPETLPLWLLRIPAIPLLGPLAVATLLLVVKGHYLRQNLRTAFAPDPVPPDYARQASALWQRRPAQAQTFARENLLDRPVMRALSPRYAQIPIPVVIVTGDSDEIVSAQEHAYRLHAALPHSTLTVLPHTGHELPQTRPQAVVDAIHLCQQQAQAPTSLSSCSAVTASGVQARARELVLRYGWNAMSYQILTPGMEYWFAREGDAVIGYMPKTKVRVVAGAPVCPQERLKTVVEEFEREAAQAGETVCFFGAAQRLQTALRELTQPHAALPIGAQPIWNPANWPAILQKHSSLRSQLNRARNKGVFVEEWSRERACNHPELQACLEEWTTARLLPPLHFLTEAVTLDRLADRRVFVAAQEEQPEVKQKAKPENKQNGEQQGNRQSNQQSKQRGKVVGFLIASPVPDRNGWLVEQIVRGNAAPNGTAELLIDAMMRHLEADGFTYVTLGLAPLSQRAPMPAGATPAWLRVTLAWARAHGTRFYNFEGLDAFKAKFKPDTWEPLYAIANSSHFSPRALYAIAAAFSDGPPVLALLRALFAAAKQELAWAWKRLYAKKEAAQQKSQQIPKPKE